MSPLILVIKVIASELVVCSLSAGVVWGYCGLAGDSLNTMFAHVAPAVGAWIETIAILIGVPIDFW